MVLSFTPVGGKDITRSRRNTRHPVFMRTPYPAAADTRVPANSFQGTIVICRVPPRFVVSGSGYRVPRCAYPGYTQTLPVFLRCTTSSAST
eukprot:195677-Rhodomonas_salina.1